MKSHNEHSAAFGEYARGLDAVARARYFHNQSVCQPAKGATAVDQLINRCTPRLHEDLAGTGVDCLVDELRDVAAVQASFVEDGRIGGDFAV